MVALAAETTSATMSDDHVPMSARATPRRRRPTLWDVTTPQYGVPMPPPGALPASSMAPSGALPNEPIPRLSAASTVGDGQFAVVGPPPPHSTDPLAGIDLQALRTLLSPAGAAHMSGSVGAGGDRVGVPSTAANFGAMPPLGSSPDTPVGSQQHATRHARRLYVGNLPVNSTDVAVGDFFNRALAYSKGVIGEGNPVISVYLNLEKRFAFIELRSLPETAAALAMDGVLFSNMSLRMRRPNDYNEAACPPSQPPAGFDPSLLGIVSTQVGDGPNKVFIGGIPYSLTEDEVKVILQTHGRLAAFNLIKDASTGTSKGFAFFEYADPSVVDEACKNLNGTVIENKTLTVRRATQHGQRTALGNGMSVGAGHGSGGENTVNAAALVRLVTTVVELRNVVTQEELEDDEEYQDVVDETEEEARKFGALKSVVVPRPSKDGTEVLGVGRIFLSFEKESEAERAFAAMDGRKFDDRTVVASYISAENFESGNY
jgi:splicing factor U2AF 65 kDa subunit